MEDFLQFDAERTISNKTFPKKAYQRLFSENKNGIPSTYIWLLLKTDLSQYAKILSKRILRSRLEDYKQTSFTRESGILKVERVACCDWFEASDSDV